MKSAALGIPTRLRTFRRNEQAFAATEFALVLPIMVFALLGATELGNAVSIQRKVTLTAHTVTDLVAQRSSNISTDLMNTLLNASAQVLAPYSSANLTITVTEVQTDANSKATVVWSASLSGGTFNPAAATYGTPVTLPTALVQPNAHYIWGVATYNYTPSLGVKLTGPISLSQQLFLAPRNVTSVPYNSVS